VKIILSVVLLAVSALAQSQSAPVESACGPGNVSFTVKQDESQHSVAQTHPGKALIYFVQVISAGTGLGTPVTRIGLDGTWVGAFKHNSYFSVSVDPGEHHACMSVQSNNSLGKSVAFAHLTAEPGKVYYLGTQMFGTASWTHLEIGPIDSDQARYLIASTPLSLSHSKP
jgi:hypothetical protein